MRLLPTKFNASGHHLVQIWRGTDVAVYQRWPSLEHKPHELELVIIRIKPDQVMPNGDRAPEHEAYPSSSDWGRCGWSFPVRYKTWVLDLAQNLVEITKARPTFVRNQTQRLMREIQKRSSDGARSALRDEFLRGKKIEAAKAMVLAGKLKPFPRTAQK